MATPEVIAIGASTGGPGILHQILRGMPGDFSIPIVIVQHPQYGRVNLTRGEPFSESAENRVGHALHRKSDPDETGTFHD